MRKEVSIAIIIGIILGGIILYGINLANTSTSNLKEQNQNKQQNLQPNQPNDFSAPSSPSSSLNITSHVSNQVLFEKEITLSGKANPSSNISIIWEDDEAIIKSDEKGIFDQKITLISGENNIQVDVLNQNSTLESKTLKLFYSTKPIQ